MKNNTRASLESLAENGDVSLVVLHPGGLGITRELAAQCHISRTSKVLDVASGTGESACYLAETFGCEIIGLDISDYMVRTAQKKAGERGLRISFEKGDAHHLPFEDTMFDAVISECTISLLDKERVIREMTRVARPGGYVGIHDIYWKEGAPESLKRRLAEIEGERPETIGGWKGLFEGAGLTTVMTADKSHLIPSWMKDIERKLGLLGLMKMARKIIKEWGLTGLREVWEAERIFRSKYIGYAVIVGRKPLLEQRPD